MLPGRTIIAELIAHVSPRKFQTCVDRYDGDYEASRFSCWDQFSCMFVEDAASFVTRSETGIRFIRRSSRPVDLTTGLLSDHVVVLATKESRGHYPQPLRRMRHVDPETHKRLVYLTNNFTLPAITIAHLYRARWQVELFFKWIRQHLRIKAYYGTSENAVKTQMSIALSVYVLVAIVKKRLALDVSLYELLQLLSVTLFEKTPISTAVLDVGSQIDEVADCNQLQLFDS